jgi:hypothetical protein
MLSPLVMLKRSWAPSRGTSLSLIETLSVALSQITCLLCLYEFDALSFLRHASEDGVYLQAQEHH